MGDCCLVDCPVCGGFGYSFGYDLEEELTGPCEHCDGCGSVYSTRDDSIGFEFDSDQRVNTQVNWDF